MSQILELLDLVPSPQSVDFVTTKRQFHLHNLLTEQRHPKTQDLSFALQKDTAAGLRMLLSVDQDVAARLEQLRRDPRLLEQAADAIAEAISAGRRIYVYGCGATGRLAKQMESSFWRPFWKKVASLPCWTRLRPRLPDRLEDGLVGEMTGGDRALVSSLEGFEDLQLLGRLQLEDHGVSRGDVVICVTEGGETSSVIGTILGAAGQYGDLDQAVALEAAKRLYFVYNNPDEILRPFDRSVSVIDNPAVTKINLATGPQGITGSTRLQATTSETFVLGVILEEALYRLLRDKLNEDELRSLGFGGAPGIPARLASFAAVKAAVDAVVPQVARLTDTETDTYRRGRFSTYFAKTALITVFIDNTERSPTFRLFPLDRADDPERRSWVQVWTEAADRREAWRNFLGRPFRGLDPAFYRGPFEEQVQDLYLRAAALRSLSQAGNDQERIYDFSFSPENIARSGPQRGDLAVLVLVDGEINEWDYANSSVRRFRELAARREAKVALLTVSDGAGADLAGPGEAPGPDDVAVRLVLPSQEDPLTLRRHIALKMLLNAHSTAIMAALGRVVGNTMTNVSPSNLKLIGRATYLIMSHVNETLSHPAWVARHGRIEPVSFAEANAVLFEAIDYVQSVPQGQIAEVAVSIVRILEAFERGAAVAWEEAREILEREGLPAFLVRHHPALCTDRQKEGDRPHDESSPAPLPPPHAADWR
jgi:N-acetylmuramic acid 6-phosphate (MurNAc-6-P) etherase